ncbi:MAG: acyltransferase family protein [Rhizobiales bacterium]|nr:acyltransferase family protein [Hyphomicrobiales bacterium]
MNSGKANYFPALDAIRFLAALGVAYFHLSYMSWGAEVSSIARLYANAARYPETVWLAWAGVSTVEVFFLISGFVIANSIAGASPFDFLKNRLLRLYPTVWVCVWGSLFALLFIGDESVSDVFGRFMRTILLVPGGGYIGGAYWTLIVEMAFYTVVLIGLCFRSHVTLTRIAWGLTLYSACFVIYVALFYLREVPYSGFIHSLDSSAGWPAALLMRHGCLFAAGIWFWHVAEGRATRLDHAGLALALVLGSAQVFLHGLKIRTISTISHEWIYSPLIFWVFACIALYVFTQPRWRTAKNGGPISGFLRQVGLMTYPFYLLHNVLGAGMLRVLIEIGVERWTALALVIFWIIGFSWSVSTMFEPRVRAVLKRVIEGVDRRFLRDLPQLAFFYRKAAV